MILDFSTREPPGVNTGISENASAGEQRGCRCAQLYQHRSHQPLGVAGCFLGCWGPPHSTQTSLLVLTSTNVHCAGTELSTGAWSWAWAGSHRGFVPGEYKPCWEMLQDSQTLLL